MLQMKGREEPDYQHSKCSEELESNVEHYISFIKHTGTPAFTCIIEITLAKYQQYTMEICLLAHLI